MGVECRGIVFVVCKWYVWNVKAKATVGQCVNTIQFVYHRDRHNSIRTRRESKSYESTNNTKFARVQVLFRPPPEKKSKKKIGQRSKIWVKEACWYIHACVRVCPRFKGEKVCAFCFNGVQKISNRLVPVVVAWHVKGRAIGLRCKSCKEERKYTSTRERIFERGEALVMPPHKERGE